jgi:hypothetical protein
MANDYPWYDIIEGSSLQQGDILFGCSLIEVAPEVTFPLPEDDLPVVVSTFDVIVLTQSCDLVNNNADSVILCPHWSLQDASELDPKLGNQPHRFARGQKSLRGLS